MMDESGTPAACICEIFSFAGWEKLQPSMLQLATVSEHPHWHASLAPTRRIFWFVLAICAQTGAMRARAKSATLLLNRDIFLGDAYYFGPGILQFDLARNQCDQCAEDQDDTARPDPTDQRKY